MHIYEATYLKSMPNSDSRINSDPNSQSLSEIWSNVMDKIHTLIMEFFLKILKKMDIDMREGRERK